MERTPGARDLKKQGTIRMGARWSTIGKRFPDPVIGTLGTFPGDIELVSVYDRSQQAEDPPFPDTGSRDPVRAAREFITAHHRGDL